MTIDHPLRRALARICSAATMARVVDPILADIRWEDGRATLRGFVALGRALALHAITSLPGWCVTVWTDDGYAMSRAAALVIGVAALGSIPLTAPPLLSQARRWPAGLTAILVMLVPQALALALPSAPVIAIPIAFRQRHLNARLFRRTVVFSLVIAAAAYGIIGWVMPEANQRFREATYMANGGGRDVTLERGPNEESWKALRRQIQGLRQTKSGKNAATQLEHNYQTRMAIAVAAVPLSLAALAMCTIGFGRRRPLVTGVSVLLVYWVFMVFEQRQAAAAVRNGDLLDVYLRVWTPNAILSLIATATLLSRRSPLPRPPARSFPAA